MDLGGENKTIQWLSLYVEVSLEQLGGTADFVIAVADEIGESPQLLDARHVFSD